MPVTKKYLSAKLAELKERYEHAGNFCFFTDTENLPFIFEAERLLCRSRAIKEGLLIRDCASPEVLSKTPSWVHDHVRLYYAPATPMLYQVEGIKRQPDKWPECPRPAYLVFDPKVLTLSHVQLSDGNMGSDYTSCQQASDEVFGSLPFAAIYHRGAIAKDPNAEAALGFDPGVADVIRKRHAEVLVPQELSLDHLHSLVFRSGAERDLAIDDIGAIPEHVDVRVDKSWFCAQMRGRPYMDTFIKGREGTYSVANPRDGDTLIQLARSGNRDPSGHRTVFKGSDWGKWESIDPVSTGLLLPEPGRRIFYLYGHRVAEEEL